MLVCLTPNYSIDIVSVIFVLKNTHISYSNEHIKTGENFRAR